MEKCLFLGFLQLILFLGQKLILVTKLITSTLNALLILSCRSSMVSGLRKHGWQRSHSQRLSMKLVHILTLFQINCLGRVDGTWAVEPYAKGQVGERSWDFFPCKCQQLGKTETHWDPDDGEKQDQGLEETKRHSGAREMMSRNHGRDVRQQTQPVTRHTRKPRNLGGFFFYPIL